MIINWKKTAFCAIDAALAVYLVVAATSFDKPNGEQRSCGKVEINISDSNNAGFLSANEIKTILQRKNVYPLNKPLRDVNPRSIEELLTASPFVNSAECFKTNDGNVRINVTQRMPIIRIINDKGNDYYLDEKGGTLPNSKYTSDLIIATGNINGWFAKYYIAPVANYLMDSELWSNQIEQINVLSDRGIELVPRVGDHVVFIGYLPQERNNKLREKKISDFLNKKLTRLEKFYRYGLSTAGWNKYEYINMEFDNQIICRRHNAGKTS